MFANREDIKGNIFNIQKFTIHDGPGIRTELFFKGCPLRCKWCSNPESLKLKQEVGVTAIRCIGVDKCNLCIEACPLGEAAFVIDNNIITGINREVCTDCLECVEACPSNALKIWGREMNVEEVMKVLLEDREFYQKSGGGITLSGGEVLLQWQFVLELLKECKKASLHTCVETAMHCQPEILDQIYPYVDLVITDIKHMDAEKHREYTGVRNDLILRNIKKTVQMGMPLVIRIPVVPGHNNDEKNIRATAQFIADELGNRVKQVQLLPYRQLGEEKYKSIGMPYPMGTFEVPERRVWEENIRHLVEVMQEYGVPAVAGTTEKI
ncbi:MAG TPA: glycyl-radical enzyme activating protein [Syntrophomonadaceae bacterium]|nr:glycyl-radical enzyme activating protein [Syntrophomonadaceae bacterium]